MLVHIILFTVGVNGGGKSGLWPFGESDSYECGYNHFCEYNLKDFAFYLIIPLIILSIWKLVGKDIIKKFKKNK